MPRKVLYIDDDQGLCALVKRSLGRDNIEVVTAGDGETGLKLLADHPDFDVVAVDLYMPGISGVELTERINALPNHPPVIVVTGAQDSRMAVAVLKAGAFDYVVKDVQGEFIFLLKAAFHTAVDAMRNRRAKEAAEAEVRAARDRFEALAAERAMLMREVNHRVGNSLQLIAAFLQLQAGGAGSASVKAALTDATRRVMAVAQVHKRLYTSHDLQSVSIDQYLMALIDDLSKTDDSDLSPLTLDAEALELDPDRAVAIGVIVNELVLNAMKYAYPEQKGPIRVGLKRVNGERAVLTVEDDGVGYDVKTKPKSTGLGRSIVGAMATRLGAEVVNDPSHSGTRVVITFETAPSKESPHPMPS